MSRAIPEHGGSSAPTSTKIFYGVGAVASGIQSHGFSYFLIYFYSNVLGVEPAKAGLAIMIALVIDAVTDPIVGYLSDNHNSKWGRRHPFMYFSALPLAICIYLIWNPPENLGTDGLFYYLLALTVSARVFMTFFEVPSASLAPELTRDYDQRTTLMGMRSLFGWWGALFIAIMAYFVFLKPSADDVSGFLNREGYGGYGALAAALIFGAIALSSLGTHGYIPHLHKAAREALPTVWRAAMEIAETVANRSLAALFLSGIFSAIAAGVNATLFQYINSYFWEFDPRQVGMLQFAYIVSAALALLMAPIVSRTLGKKAGFMVIGGISAVALPLPVLLRLLGLFPPNHSPELFFMILAFSLVDIALIILSTILIASMLADVVEDSQVKTGRRSEGVFFAANSFLQKAVSGIGAFVATLLLTAIAFPTQIAIGEISAEKVTQLGYIYVPTLMVLYLFSTMSIVFYGIDRERHSSNLRSLNQKSAKSAQS